MRSKVVRRRRRTSKKKAAVVEQLLGSDAVVNSPPHVREWLRSILQQGARSAGPKTGGTR
jgi:hypothetical protein